MLRGLSPAGLADWRRLAATGAFTRLTEQGLLVGTRDFEGEAPPSPRGTPWAGVIEHDRIPVVSYPYEWPFAMLRSAAALTLDVLIESLNDGLTLKDGTAYNVQFVGTDPVFIDIGSFTPASGPWPGYRQFCETLLFPLMLQAHLGFSYHPLLRGRVNGIEASEMRALFRGRRVFRRGVMSNIVVQSALQQRLTKGSEQAKQDLARAGAGLELAKASARKLRKLVGKLEVSKERSTWSDYRTTCTYTDADAAAKRAFVEGGLKARSATRVVLDLGANDGEYSVLAAPHADTVVASDFDELTIDRLARGLAGSGPKNVLPLVVDLVDPSPAIGWDNRERSSWQARMQPDVVLALALVHHLAIGANVPLPMVIDWLAGFDATLIVEFVAPDDPQSKRLLANKPAGLFGDYRRDAFEQLLAGRFSITRSEELASGTRVLYEAEPIR